MFNIILFQPDIPSNTGNIIRLCANTGSNLHLIEPLGFSLESRHLRRAGLDYSDLARVQLYPSLDACRDELGTVRLATFSTHHSRTFTDFKFADNDALIFGSETRGLPRFVAESVQESARLTIPMLPSNRSLNLSNSVAIVIYEAWRQLGFRGSRGFQSSA